MSGLGETIIPGSEPGSVAGPVPLQPETTPDNPSQIAQSTAIQTLDQLLNGNWILTDTFTASTTMPAGTILFLKPIHPRKWNWPNVHVSQMFNTWTGSGKVRYRPLATAWYGGSIRVGFLPPNLTETQIRAMPVEVLTAYPNEDIDPKNTCWVHFRGPDQREIAYHYMKEFDDSDPQSFGGYIVFYIAGKLVTQAPDFTTIQFVVELAGDFMYDQPNPRALEPSEEISQPLGYSLPLPIELHPLCDSHDSGHFNAVQVNAISVTKLLSGGIHMSAVGLPKAAGKIPSLLSLPVLNSYQTNTFPSSAWMATTPEGAFMAEDSIPLTPALDNLVTPHLNQVKNSQTTAWYSIMNTSGVTYKYMHPSGITTDEGNSISLQFTRGVETARPDPNNMLTSSFSCLVDSNTPVVNPIDPALCDGLMSLSPMASGESIISFVNLQTQKSSPQTAIHADQLGKWPTNDSASTTSYLYNLVNDTGTPILTIRLNPNGMFTTTAVSTAVIYPGTVSMRYVGTLDINQPLPPLTMYQRNLRQNLMRWTRKKASDVQVWKEMRQELASF